ncbi:MAG: glycine zipper 2TM domain-containing protein [Thiohalobacteraceae bacterium]|nr:glycine zipper 2TM domain-containing protein [Gammaproteobacteria bacterium]
MNRLQRVLISLAVSGATLAAAPLAHADKVIVNNHYYGSHDNAYRYDERRHPRHDKHRRKHQRTVVHEHHYYPEPVVERVIVVERPVYEPARYYDEPRYYGDEPGRYPPAADGYRSATPMIVGGIIGGVLGNQVGKGRGKDVATVAGAILGGSIGRDTGYRR